MKNIHVLPTDKPSRLIINWEKDLCYKSNPYSMQGTQNIYITSDEEIKRYLDYYLDINTNEVKTSFENIGKYSPNEKKIILTTDQDLIKDGVQAIDDEFLEWFVKNPSCEEVEVKNGVYRLNSDGEEIGFPDMSLYKIIIPKEEPFKHKVEVIPAEEILANRSNAYEFIDFDKQEELEGGITITHIGKETLKEVAKNYSERHQDVSGNLGKYLVNAVFIDGANWQQERSYSDMQEYAKFCIECDRKEMPLLLVEDWYEHYKKK